MTTAAAKSVKFEKGIIKVNLLRQGVYKYEEVEGFKLGDTGLGYRVEAIHVGDDPTYWPTHLASGCKIGRGYMKMRACQAMVRALAEVGIDWTATDPGKIATPAQVQLVRDIINQYPR